MNFNYSVSNLFDFDQKWDALPNNGGMYCVPTAMTNLMGFLAQNGSNNLWRRLPSWMPGSSPQFSNGNIVNNIAIMGDYMDTDAQDGTSMSDALDGLEDFVEDRFWGAWYSRACGSGDTIRINHLKNHLQLKRLATVCFGRYERDDPHDANSYDRMSGHCLTVQGLRMSSTGTTLLYHDPSSGDGINAQSARTVHSLPVSNHSLECDGDIRKGIKMHVSGGGSTRMIDSYIVLSPMLMAHHDDVSVTVSYSSGADGASGADGSAGNIETHKVILPREVGTIRSFVLNPEATVAYITSAERKGIWRIPLGERTVERLTDAVQPDHLVVTADETVLASVGTAVFAMPEGGIAKQVATLGAKPDALTYDHRRKSLLAVAASTGKVFRVDGAGKTVAMDMPVMKPAGKLSATVQPRSGLLYLAQDDTPDFTRLSLRGDAVRGMSEGRFENAVPAANTHINSRDVIAASVGGKLQFFDERGKAVTVQGWTNRPTGKGFKVARSFHNLDPMIMRQKKWRN